MRVIEKCRWCGKLYIKKNNAQKYCSTYCKQEAKRETDRAYINKHNKRTCYNTRIKNIVELGSLGTSSSFHRRKTFEEEYRSIRSEFRMLKL